MKFNIKASLLLGFAITLCCVLMVTSSSIKEKRTGSVMEFMNGFFSSSGVNNDHDAEKVKERNHVKKTHKHKKQNKVKKHKNYRFKENYKLELSNGTSGNSSGGNATPTSDPMLGDWFMISSQAFLNPSIFPPVTLHSGQKLTIHTDPDFFRINDAYEKASDDKPPTEKFFWFRLSGLNIYYSTTKTDINILGAVLVTAIERVGKHDGPMSGSNVTYCFSVQDIDRHNWKLCSLEQNITDKWVCAIKTLLNEDDPKCKPNNGTDNNTKIIEKQITQPIIIIPLPSRQCNDGWNYQKNGDDWECDCSEGKEQSPIDLPSVEEAIDSPVKPLFQYEEVASSSKITTIDGQMRENAPLKLSLLENNLKIFHNKFGKVVTMDGAVYYAQEIIIHTPAEHTIEGKKFDMEVQIVHYGQSKGDIAKQIILSFVFEKTPGVYNKFMDDLDFFNLPNPISKERDITTNIFIPKILYSADDEEIPVMKPFSFYTYQGSLTTPPCTENTIIYVASKPIKLGSTAIQLFQEALRIPDIMNQKGDVIVSNWIPMSNRNIQELNGRPVFHYNHEKYCGPDPQRPEPPRGHYEKVMKSLTKYFYVNGPQPSGLPNAFVVSEKEALGEVNTLNGNGNGNAHTANSSAGHSASCRKKH
jgi:carbonic anhydrase